MSTGKLIASTKFRLGNWTASLLYLFLATDVTFIILYVLYAYTSLISNSYFSLEQDRGYAEIFQYLKEYWIVLLLGFVAIQLRSFLLCVWSLLFFYLLLDDATKIHETWGLLLSKELAFPAMFGLRSEDFGELAVVSLVGSIFLCLLATAYWFGDRFSRQASQSLLLLTVCLSTCGILVDMLHIPFRTTILDSFFVIVEDGGELIVMSFILYFAFVLFRSSLNSKHKTKKIDNYKGE